MSKWRIAESLKKLREEINAEFPTRSKVSDGAIGDAAHASRSSDHNPWVKDGSMGIVTAIDITHDPKSGCTGDKLATALVESRDPRIKYLIWNRRIIASYPTGGQPAWTWRPYSGANAHAHHLHISVSDKKNLYDSRDDWDLNFDMAVSLPLERVGLPVSDIQQPELASSPGAPLAEEETPAQQTASVTLKDGEVKAEINVAPSEPENVAVEKPAPLGFAASMKKKISTVVGGNVTLQVIRDYAEQAKAIGLSERFWMWISIFAVVGGLVWLAVEVYRHWSANRRELEITKELVAANTNDTNTVTLADTAELTRYKEIGYKIVRR